MSTTTPLIQLENVTKKYPLGGNNFYQSLNGVTIKINEGEFIAIIGPSGSGKSTTMHILGALDLPTTGHYFFKGKDIGRYSSDELAEIRNEEIGFVFQSFNLLPRTTVYKNVERPMLYGKVPPPERKLRIETALKLVGLDDKIQNLSNQLSGGQIQRVAIARAIIMNPRLILADEPTGNLDTKTSYEIMHLFESLHHKQGRTVIVITHEPDIAKIADRIIKIVDGKILSDERIRD